MTAATTARDLVNSVFHSWGRALLRYAISLTHDRAAAEDIVQEVFLSLYASLSSGAIIENPRFWTLAVTRNLVGKYHREQAKLRSQTGSLEESPSLALDVEAHLNALEALETALRCLTEREQQVLLLRMESLRYEEIGEELGITAGSVATLLSRAAKKVKKALAGKTLDSYSLTQARGVDAGPLQ